MLCEREQLCDFATLIAHVMQSDLLNRCLLFNNEFACEISVMHRLREQIILIVLVYYTCQLPRIMHESHACGSKIVTTSIRTSFSRPTDNSEAE